MNLYLITKEKYHTKNVVLCNIIYIIHYYEITTLE